MIEAIKCRKCGGMPHVIKVEECFYARCDKCTKWHPFEFLGITREAAIRNWNEGNLPNGSRVKE